jgi:YidC/Oxa1 family membrane protein insertase
LIAWQYFVGMPQMEKQRQEAQTKAQQTQSQPQQPPASGQVTPGQVAPGQIAPGQVAPGQPGGVAPQLPGQGSAPTPTQQLTREAVLKASPRVAIETPKLAGSIGLKGAQLDDIALTQYRETVDPKSPPIVLLSPAGSPHPFYAEFGWAPAAGATLKLPDSSTLWTQQGAGTLGVGRPVTLTWNNGEGLEFRRVFSVDDRYLISVQNQIINRGTAPVTLYPFALIRRIGTPETLGYYILHEGLIGVFGDQGLQEVTYSDMEKKKTLSFKASNAWLGITDKYWAATLLPDSKAAIQGQFSFTLNGNQKSYQTDYFGEARTVAPGATASDNTRLFAGAKEVAIVGINWSGSSLGGYN